MKTELKKLGLSIVFAAILLEVFIVLGLAGNWITNGLFGWVDAMLAPVVLFGFFALVATPVIIRFQKRIAWRMLGTIALVVAPLSVYLRWDDPVSTTPLKLESLAPPPPRAAESYAQVLWSPRNPGEREPTRWPPAAAVYLRNKSRFDEWRVFVVANREAFQSDWAACTAVREWILSLDDFEMIGDLTTSYGGPKINHVLFRDVCLLHCAYASLLAIEGRGAEALEVLRPMLSVARKLKPAARTPFRYSYIGGQSQRLCQNAVLFVLQTAAVSKGTLRRIEATLAPPEDLTSEFRRVFLCDCAIRLREGFLFSSPSTPVSLILPFINLHASENLAVQYYDALIKVAVEGKAEGFVAHERALERELQTASFKNPWGRLFIATRLGHLIRESIGTEDSRCALLAEVRAKLAEVEQEAVGPVATPPPKGTP